MQKGDIMAIIDVVRFDGLRSRDWLIYKYYSDDLVTGSQLIVQEGQVAIFIKGGTVCDVFYPGTYTLETENLPLLNRFLNMPFGGRTPFSAEIYFINTTTKLDLHWGTSDPIQLIDPKYYVKLRIRAYGQMGMRLADYTAFFRELIGGMQQADLVKFDKIKEFYRGILVIKVKSIIAETILSEKVSALEIASKLDELSEKVKAEVSPEFERYGFAITSFYIQSINFPDEDFAKINEILKDKAAFEIMGDGRYATKRSFDVYEGAATNANGAAGVLAAGGLGMGAAVNMGQAMKDVVGRPAGSGAEGDTKECPSCRKKIAAASKFCPECGYNCTPSVCACGHKLQPGSRFCPECGRRVGGE